MRSASGERNQYKDARLILVMRGMRSLAYGLLAVLLGVALASEGFSPVAIGTLITVSLVGDFVGTYVIGLVTDIWGRRRVLALLALLMAGTGVVFALATSYTVLLLAAFFGTLGTSASETAPFLPIDQAMIAQVTTPERRTVLFARYNLVASLSVAVGALAAGLPDLLTRLGLSFASGVRLLFGVYAVLALIVAGLSALLSPQVEVSTRASIQAQRLGPRLVPPLGRSRGVVLRLTALFGVDALAGGLVVQSLMVLFFHLRFGVPLTTLSALFFGANLLSALSFLAAAPLARRFGLLNTMVFTHLPSNVILLLVPIAPTFPLAAMLLLLRQALSQMDVPTRQAYTMALVAPEERTAAASVTSLARSVGSASSPALSGVLLQGSLLVFGLPFILAGILKAAYDCSLWLLFRQVRLQEEEIRST
ncbi:MAG TPA: MFS transporter [Ktedonobacteraceae bacterium]|nr:MFS transporter [Ktedonobacteraceae bacterium]